MLVHASANYKAVAFHIKRWDLEKQTVRNALGDHKASCHWVLFKELAQLQITAASTIANQDAVAPATPSTTGGLKDKYNIISLILKRMCNRKYF